jgi:hypothetical protein
MRRVIVTLTLLSLGFAPAPFPKAERREPETPERRALRECDRRLRELGVTWRLETRDGVPCVRFGTGGGRGAGDFSCRRVRNGDVRDALQTILRYVERLRFDRSASP